MSYEADDAYDLYTERRVRARCEHRCCACKEPIARGHVYMRVAFAFEGRADSLRRCLRCQAIHEHLRQLCWTSGGGEQWPEENLGCGIRYEDEWGELPEEIAALAFRTGGEMQP